MKRSRFTEEQIIGILREHQAGLGAKDLCRRHAVNDATFYKWRACALAGIDPRVYRRAPTRLEYTDLRARLKDLSSERRRLGYRRLHLLLRREGWSVNLKKLYRIVKRGVLHRA